MDILSPGSKGKAFQEQEAFLPRTFPKDDFALGFFYQKQLPWDQNKTRGIIHRTSETEY